MKEAGGSMGRQAMEGTSWERRKRKQPYKHYPRRGRRKEREKAEA